VPCYRCGARQTDPGRGASPWRRGVRGTEQVLVCPECQARPDWTAELDRCPRCGSTALVRRLGQTVCRDCESAPDKYARSVATADSLRTATEPAETADQILAAEVAAAIDRVLGRVPAASSAGSTSGTTAPAHEVP
jgi:ribosomal protein L40E